MPAYMILQSRVINPDGLTDYREAVKPLMAAHGGKPIARATPIELLEGNGTDRPVSIFEFPSMEALQGFWHSEEYKKVKPLRAGAAEMDIWAVAGL